MDALNDDCLLLILKRFDLNARTRLRLVSKRFRCLCDSIKIKQLVVYENNVPLPGKLEHSGKKFGLLDTVYVFDLQKFFDSPILLDQMASIRTLSVIGEDRTLVESKLKFDHLVHLELHNLQFAEPYILESPKLQHLILKGVEFDADSKLDQPEDETAEQSGSKLPASVYLAGFNKLTSKQIRYLSLEGRWRVDASLLAYCVENGLFDSIEHLRTGLTELRSLQYLSDRCPALRRIDVLEKPKYLIKLIRGSEPEQLVTVLRDDLAVFLLGLPFNQTTVESIGVLLEALKPTVTTNSERAIILDDTATDLLKSLETKHDLKEFYRSFDHVLVYPQPMRDLEWMRKFSFCTGVITGFGEDFNFGVFKRFLGIFPELQTIELAGEFEFKYDAKLVNLIARQKQIAKLIIEIPNEINLDFLLSFPRLKYLQMNSAQAIKQNFIIELLEASVHLYVADLLFIKPVELQKEQLSAFKKLVNNRFRDRFKARALLFKIEVHSRKSDKFVRYALGDEENPVGKFDSGQKNRMFTMIEYMHKEMRCCRCHTPVTPSTSYPR